MARSTKADKARQLNVAHRLLQRNVALPEAAQRLAHQFGLSLRQAYRYLEEAAELDAPVEVVEATVMNRSCAAVPVTIRAPRAQARRVFIMVRIP